MSDMVRHATHTETSIAPPGGGKRPVSTDKTTGGESRRPGINNETNDTTLSTSREPWDLSFRLRIPDQLSLGEALQETLVISRGELRMRGARAKTRVGAQIQQLIGMFPACDLR